MTKSVGLIPRGVGAGAAMAGCGALLYLLIFAAYAVANDLTAHGTPAASVRTQDNPVDDLAIVLWFGALLGVLPAILAGAFGGLLIGATLTLSRRFQGTIRAWLTGTVLLYVVALVVNYLALTLRETRLQFDDYVVFLGLPSLVYVLAAGPFAVWLHRRGRLLEADANPPG